MTFPILPLFQVLDNAGLLQLECVQYIITLYSIFHNETSVELILSDGEEKHQNIAMPDTSLCEENHKYNW